MQSRLARGIHASAGLDDIPHDDRADGDSSFRAADGFANNRGAQISRRNFFQTTSERANSGSHRMTQNDVTIFHLTHLLRSSGEGQRRVKLDVLPLAA
jgi:hypothetical protein